MSNEITVPKYECPNLNCKYQWTPRVRNPRFCPRCLKRLNGQQKIVMVPLKGGVGKEAELVEDQ